MRRSLKHTYKKLLSNNPAKARRKKIVILDNYRNFLMDANFLNKSAQKVLKKEGR